MAGENAGFFVGVMRRTGDGGRHGVGLRTWGPGRFVLTRGGFVLA